MRLYRGRAKHGATKHSRRSDQHRASQYRMRANRLLSHRVSGPLYRSGMDLAFICRQFVIVGAGAAGLMTARELWARGQRGDGR
jgi:hypothetical protein